MTPFVPSVIEGRFDSIFDLDVSPAVYDVSVKRSDHMDGYQAILAFRRPHAPGLDYISTHGDTPELALQALHDTLMHNFGKCEHCGGYRSPEK
jgi:hypothetical protein